MRTTLMVLVLGLSLAGCAGNDAKVDAPKASAPAASTQAAVTVKDFTFGPKTISVKAGGTVTWANKDDFDHSVQIDALQSEGTKFGPQTMPATYSYRFTKAGTYAYICGVHNSMTGTVVVTN